MTRSESLDFEFVKGLPVKEKSRWRKVVDHFTDVKAVVREHGMIIPVKLAADIAGVSKQRIHELLEGGQLKRVDFHGHPFVAENTFVEWAKSERKAGRPVNLPKSLAEKLQVGQGKPRRPGRVGWVVKFISK